MLHKHLKRIFVYFFVVFFATTIQGQNNILRGYGDKESVLFRKRVILQANKYPKNFYLGKKNALKKVIALTFDDSPDLVYTAQVLHILEVHGVVGTFFLVGDSIRKYPSVAKKIVDAGHIVGSHAYNHTHLMRFTPENAYTKQVVKAQNTFEKHLGVVPLLFRPPYGDITNAQIAYLAKQNIRIINWSVDSFDYNKKMSEPARMVRRVRQLAYSGAIVLLHSAGGKKEHTIQALPKIITNLQKQGYTFVTVPTLLGIKAYQ
jgi:peptidoglycan/xylan/chitin deacetylase (PgdA/CDA1 family)